MREEERVRNIAHAMEILDEYNKSHENMTTTASDVRRQWRK